MNKLDEAEKTLRKSSELLSRIGGLKSDLLFKQSSAEQKVSELKDKLPELLAANTLGESAKSEIKATRKETNRLKEFLADIPLITEGFERRERKLNPLKLEAERLLQKKTKYDEIKEELLNKYNYRGAEMLSILAKRLGLEDESETFLAGLKSKAA